MSDRSQRTEKPTPRRIERARKEGRFVASRDLAGAVQFLAFVLLAGSLGEAWYSELRHSLRQLLAQAFTVAVTPSSVAELTRNLVWRHAGSLGATGLIVAAAAAGAHLGITRFGFSLSALSPNVGRLNPVARLRELPKQNLPLLLQGLVLLPVFAGALWAIMTADAGAFLRLPLQPVEAGVRVIGESVAALLWKAAAIFVVFGALDYFRQYRKWMSGLRMTKEELRQEMKEMEGNPQIKGKIRRLQREASRRRMMHQVPSATAIVVNPTHFAVAIRYLVESMTAPVVVAKGRNLLAARIKRIAAEHKVPIVENPPLARALYQSCEVGQEIPPNLYRAIAEILAYIYRLNGGRLAP